MVPQGVRPVVQLTAVEVSSNCVFSLFGLVLKGSNHAELISFNL